jgi:antitoxin VapB
MALSIKNPEAERLAAEVAKKTGETMTNAVIIALRERLERLTGSRHAPQLEAAMLEISQRCSALPNIHNVPVDVILGYDKNGTFEE